MSYAIIATGGKQYRVQKGDIIEVELLGGDDDTKVEFKEVLFVGGEDASHVGIPTVKGFVVKGQLLGTVKGPKLKAMKYKKRKQAYRTFGHRQHYSQVEVLDIAKV